MSTIITPNIASFKEGEVYVYTLPEEPKLIGYTKEFAIQSKDAYNEAVSYARAHPFKFAEKDKEKVKEIIYWTIKIPKQRGLMPKDWLPQDLTEYRIEGLKFETEERFICSGVGEPISAKWCGTKLEDKCKCESVQVACLIEDDGVKN